MKIAVGDLEANGLDDATVIHCGVFKDINTKEMVEFLPHQLDEMFAYLDTVDVLIMHNGISYDWPLMKRLYGYEFKGKKVDTIIMSRLQQPDRPRPFGYKGKGGPHSVDAWGFRLGRWKPEHEDWSRFSPEMLHRCSEDVEIQCLIYDELLREAKELGGSWTNAWKLSFNLFDIVQKQEDFGWLTDRTQMDFCLTTLARWIGRIDKAVTPQLPTVLEPLETKEAGVRKWVRKPFLKSGKHNKNVTEYWGEQVSLVVGPHSRILFRKVGLNKEKEVKKYLLDIGWIPAVWNVSKKTGERTSPKLNAKDPFDGVEGKIGQVIAKRVQCADRVSTITGWINRTREDGRLASRISSFAVTGRATHANIANVPNLDTFFGKWMRKCFTSPEGRVLVGCDAGSCQDRMLADRAKDPALTKMLLEGDKTKGTDSHSLAMKVVNKVAASHSLRTISRTKAKAFNLGWKFGSGDSLMGSMLQGSEVAGAQIRKGLEKTFPAQAALVEELTRVWRSNAKQIPNKWGGVKYKSGWIPGLDGRPVHIESEHAILVYMLQTDEAIMMAGAYVMLYKRLLARGYKWGVDWAYVCWYHDEYTIECREEIAEDIAKMAEQAIVDSGTFFNLTHCPQVGEAEIGRTWYDIH
jgi:DNA polymerase-1